LKIRLNGENTLAEDANMSAGEWKHFVRHAKTSLLQRFGGHIARIVDCERNEQAGKREELKI
jgi:hypothetical protein